MNSLAPVRSSPTESGFVAATRIAVALAVATAAGLLSLNAADVNATLDAAAKAMGATNVNSVQVTATGFNGTFGQSFKPGGPWPAFKVTSYTQTINFADPSMRIELERTNPDGPLQGSGLPLSPPLPQNKSRR